MSYLQKVIEGMTSKPKISVTRLREHDGDRPSNLQPETTADLIALSIRDLGMIQQDMQSHLKAMQRDGGDERLILQVENEVDLMQGIIDRLKRAAAKTTENQLDDPETRAKWQRQYHEAYGAEVMNKDEWLPASGGTETPFKARSGSRLLYVWNPSKKKHAYLNLDTDTILSDEEARQHLQTY